MDHLTRIVQTRDFAAYAQRYLYVQTKTAGLQPFRLWPMQLHQERERTRRKCRRVIRLKFRQGGSSIYELARMTFLIGNTADTHGLIMAHEDKLPTEFIDKIKFMFELTPPWAKPVMKFTDREIEFLDTRCSIRCGTARTMGEGSGAKLGRTCNYLFMTEMADSAWKDAVIDALIQTVPPVDTDSYPYPLAEVCAESTANGAVGRFYKEYRMGKTGDGTFTPFFYEWWWHPEYIRRPAPGFIPTEEETRIALAHNLSLEQIAFRRWKIAEIGERKFRELYPESDVECFLLSGSQFFDGQALRRFLESREHCLDWPSFVGDIFPEYPDGLSGPANGQGAAEDSGPA